MKGSTPLIHRCLGWNLQGDLGPYTIYTSKRKKIVVYEKAPPTSPPTRLQLLQRNRFRLAASLWRSLTPDTRTAWHNAAKGAHLGISGYNLFCHWTLRQQRSTIATIERQTGIKLVA